MKVRKGEARGNKRQKGKRTKKGKKDLGLFKEGATQRQKRRTEGRGRGATSSLETEATEEEEGEIVTAVQRQRTRKKGKGGARIIKDGPRGRVAMGERAGRGVGKLVSVRDLFSRPR